MELLSPLNAFVQHLVFQCRLQNIKLTKLICVFRVNQGYDDYGHTTTHLFGHPTFVAVPRKKCTYDIFYKAALRRMKLVSYQCYQYILMKITFF